MTTQRKTVIVTGASQGIGAADTAADDECKELVVAKRTRAVLQQLLSRAIVRRQVLHPF